MIIIILGYLPSVLPISCLTLPPNFPKDSPVSAVGRRPLGDNTNKGKQNFFWPLSNNVEIIFVSECASPQLQARKDQMSMPVRALKSVPENQVLPMTVDLNNKQADPNANGG